MTVYARYIVNQTVSRIYERKQMEHISGFGETAVMREVLIGWAIELAGSPPMTILIPHKPDIRVGCHARIVIEFEEGPCNAAGEGQAKEKGTPQG